MKKLSTKKVEPGKYNIHYGFFIFPSSTNPSGGNYRLKLKVENTIRWQYGYDKDSNVVKESNARLVKWSDGSMTLHVGSEIFDVDKQSFVVRTNFYRGLNKYSYHAYLETVDDVCVCFRFV